MSSQIPRVKTVWSHYCACVRKQEGQGEWHMVCDCWLGIRAFVCVTKEQFKLYTKETVNTTKKTHKVNRSVWAGSVRRVSKADSAVTERAYVSIHTCDLHTPPQTDRQYSSDSKLLRLPPQPPKMKGAQRPSSFTKYQRGNIALHGPVSAFAQHTSERAHTQPVAINVSQGLIHSFHSHPFW